MSKEFEMEPAVRELEHYWYVRWEWLPRKGSIFPRRWHNQRSKMFKDREEAVAKYHGVIARSNGQFGQKRNVQLCRVERREFTEVVRAL